MDNIKEIVRENLVMLRKAHKLTQIELSQKIGYSDKAISRWETGEVTPDIETLNNLAELYERMGREADIAKALKLAQDNLHSPTLPHDGYYDFTVSKCLPTFEHFGYKL